MQRRKRFLMAICFAVAGLLVASCATVTPETTPIAATPGLPSGVTPPPTKVTPPAPIALTATPLAPVSQKPNYGGILTVGHAEDPPNFDAHQVGTYSAQNILSPCYSSLVQVDPIRHSDIIGDLSDGWKISPDGLTYTFHLRESVKFSDGSTLTASDVKYTLDRIGNPPKGVFSPRQGFFTGVDRVEAPNANTIVIRLKHPVASLLAALGSGWGLVYSKQFLEAHGGEPNAMKFAIMGTGPFKLKRASPGASYELVKHDGYFVLKRPYLDGIAFYVVRDAAARIAAIRTGRVKIILQYISPAQAEVLEQMGDKIVIERKPRSSNIAFIPRLDQPPFTNPKVRRAMQLTFDRYEAVKVLGRNFGYSYIGGLSLPPPGGAWGLPMEELVKLPGYGRDIEANRAEARRLLADEGYADGFDVTLVTRTGLIYEETAVWVAEQLKKVGVRPSVRILESGAYFDVRDTGRFSALISPIAGNTLDDPDDTFLNNYMSRMPKNIPGLRQPDVDELAIKQSQTPDPEKRKELAHQLEKLVMSYDPVMIIAWSERIVPYWKQVKDYHITSSQFPNQKLQDVWLAPE